MSIRIKKQRFKRAELFLIDEHKQQALIMAFHFIFGKLSMSFLLCVMAFSLFAQSTLQTNISNTPEKGTIKIDGIDWYVLKHTTLNSVKYSMLVSKNRLQSHVIFNSSGNQDYRQSNLRNLLESIYITNLPSLRSIAVVPSLKLDQYTSKLVFSEPTAEMAGSKTKDIFFAPSYADVYAWNGNKESPLVTQLQNYYLRWWTRTGNADIQYYVWEVLVQSGTMAGTAHAQGTGDVGAVGALWVRVTPLTYSISGTVSGLSNNGNIAVYYTVNGAAQQSTPTNTDGVYTISGIPSGANVVITASSQPDYTSSVSSLPSTSNVTANLTGKDILYCSVVSMPATAICVGEIIQLSPSSGGAWISNNNSVASVTGTGSAKGLSAGTTDFTFTSTSGKCIVSTSTLTVRALPTLTSSTSKSICSNSSVNYTATGATPHSSVSWTRTLPNYITSSLTSNSGQNATIDEILTNSSSNPINVIYTFILTANGCSKTENVTITVNPSLTLSSVTSKSICSGSSVGYTATSATPGAAFSWKRAAVITGITSSAPSNSGSNANITEELTNSTNTPINVTYEFTLTANGCTSTQNVTVTVNPKPTLNSPTNSMTITTGDHFVYTATSAVANTTFQWSRAAVAGISQSSTGIIDGSYINELLTNTTGNSVNVTYEIILTANGCSNTQYFTVKVDIKPTLSSTLTKTICSGDSVNYTATSTTSGVGYSWTRDAVSGITPSTSSGNNPQITEKLINNTLNPIDVIYVFTLSAGSGSANTQNVTVTVKPTPALGFPVTKTTCSGSAINFTVNSTLPNTSFIWTRPKVTGIMPETGSGTSSFINEILTNSTSAPLNVDYLMTLSANGCSSTGNIIVTVTVDQAPTLSSKRLDSICSGNPVNYVATSHVPLTTFNWSRNPVAGIIGTTPAGADDITEVLTNTTTAPIDVIYEIVMQTPNCVNTQDVTIKVKPTPVLTSVTSKSICNGAPVDYHATSNIAGTTFTWSRAAVSGISEPAGSGMNGNINEILTNTTNNPVMVIYSIVMNANGCTHTQNLTVTVNNTLLLNSVTSDSVCSGISVGYTATSATPNVTFCWDREETPGILEAKFHDNSNMIMERLTNTTSNFIDVDYKFTLMESGCSYTQNVTITVKPKPKLTSQKVLSAIASGDTLHYSATTNIPNVSMTWYRLQVAGIYPSVSSASGNTITEVLVNINETPVEVVYLFILTANGCTSAEYVTVAVEPHEPIFEIWNWEDLAYVAKLAAGEIQGKQLSSYNKYIVMQDIGVPGGFYTGVNGEISNTPNYGDGSQMTLPHTTPDVIEAHAGLKKYGWYGYEGFGIGAPNFNNLAPEADMIAEYKVNYKNNRIIAYGWESSAGWKPIGATVEYPFNAILDGQRFSINGLWTNRPFMTGQGLFGNVTAGGYVHDLSVVINPSSAILGSSAGGFVGNADGAIFKNCSSTGTVEAGIAGGFAAQTNNSLFTNCYTAGKVSTSIANAILGGFSGILYGQYSRFTNCYSSATVKGSSYCGGFIGWDPVGLNAYLNCYVSGKIINTKADNLNTGAFVGAMLNSASDFQHCYFDKWTSGKTTGAGSFPNFVTGSIDTLSTREMTHALSFDFNIQDVTNRNDLALCNDMNPWVIIEGVTYPFLYWQDKNAAISRNFNLNSIQEDNKPLNINTPLSVCLESNSSKIYTISAHKSDALYAIYSDYSNAETTVQHNSDTIVIWACSKDYIVKPYILMLCLEHGVVVKGTLFPFVQYNIQEVDTLYSVVAQLYDTSLISQGPEAILASQPLYTVTAKYYDGSDFIPNTPKYPGYSGQTNNPGVTINWAAMGYRPSPTNNTYLLPGELPQTNIGVYKFENVLPGDYVLALSRGGYATRFAEVTIADADTLLGHRELILGDTNGDLVIDAEDIRFLTNQFSSYGDPAFNSALDLNGDLSVDMSDVSLIRMFLNFIITYYSDTSACFK